MSIIARLIEAGVDADLIEEVAVLVAERNILAGKLATEPAQKVRSTGALRTQRYRERKAAEASQIASQSVTCDESDDGSDVGDAVVTAPSLSLSPNENNSNPHTHTHPDNIPAHEADAGSRDGLGEFEPDPVPTFTPDDLWRMWNRAAQEMGLPKVREMTEARRKRALTMIRKYGREGFVEAISAIERSTFLRGQTEQQFKADLDFLLQQKSFTRLIEGFYDRSSRANSRSRYEPDGAMAYLQRSLGIEGGYEPSGSPGRWDDGQPQGGHLLPDSRG